jgi:hypothetical protein
MAMAQTTLELHTQEFVDSLAGARFTPYRRPARSRFWAQAQSIPVGKRAARSRTLSIRSEPARHHGSLAPRQRDRLLAATTFWQQR